MKKIFVSALILFLLTDLIPWAAAESGTNDKTRDFFSGAWSTDGALASIRFSDGCYYVHIEMYDCGYDSSEWDYTCLYDEKNICLKDSGTGSKVTVSYDFDSDTDIRTVEYRDGSAEFDIDENDRLVWIDHMEDAGKVLHFKKMGGYFGTWSHDNISVEFYITGEIIICTVTMTEADNIVIWTYYCDYDIPSGRAMSDPKGLKENIYNYDTEEEYALELYHDGQADFLIDDEGYLIWIDYKEDQGNGLKFVHFQ